MKTPTLLLTLLLAVPAASSATAGKTANTKVSPDTIESPLKLGAKTAEGFDDPEHIHFFRYQAYLRKNDHAGLDAEAWKKLGEGERAAKIKAGEDWLKNKFSVLMNAQNLNGDDSALLAAIWGKDVASATAAVGKALTLGDPEQIRMARQKVQGLVNNIGGASVDWAAIFDGEAPGVISAPDLPDPLKLKKEIGFLDSLDSKEVRAPLASKATFVSFLKKKGVPADALPPLAAIYDIFLQAKEPEKTEIAHILPTVVRFLNDRKKIVNEDMPGALGFAVPGEYDKPERVGITSALRTTDPIIAGKTIAHEFQHIYDMYTGRYYTIDSEMRGFKTAVLYFRVLKQTAPAKYSELLNSDDDQTRSIIVDAEQYSKALDQGPQPFFQAVAFGHNYSSWEQGVFQGRVPLREAVDPDLGAARELGSIRVLREQAKIKTAELEKKQEDIRKRREAAPSRDLDKELEKVTKDLAGARSQYTRYDSESTLKEIRLRRMQSEVDWMNKKTRKKGAPDEPFDLDLPVDKDYVIP
mgnify:CR=1 FL=1